MAARAPGPTLSALASRRDAELSVLHEEVYRAEYRAVDRKSPRLVGHKRHAEHLPRGDGLHGLVKVVSHLEPMRLHHVHVADRDLNRLPHGDRDDGPRLGRARPLEDAVVVSVLARYDEVAACGPHASRWQLGD